jgi:hypothetical protein
MSLAFSSKACESRLPAYICLSTCSSLRVALDLLVPGAWQMLRRTWLRVARLLSCQGAICGQVCFELRYTKGTECRLARRAAYLIALDFTTRLSLSARALEPVVYPSLEQKRFGLCMPATHCFKTSARSLDVSSR